MPAHLYIVNGGDRDNHGSPRSGGARRSCTSSYCPDQPHVGIDFVDIWP